LNASPKYKTRRKLETAKKIYCGGGAEESTGGDSDAAATVSYAVKGGDGEKEEDFDAAAALPLAIAPMRAPSVYCCDGERSAYCYGGAEESKGGGGEEKKGGGAAATFAHAVWPGDRQARRQRRGYTASGEVTENRASVRSSVGSVKINGITDGMVCDYRRGLLKGVAR
jgi:hypothetical protein